MRRLWLTTVAFGLLLAAIGVHPARPEPPNFGVVVPEGIYRGGQPTSSDLKFLKQLGVRTIVKLNHSGLEGERRQSARLGMKFFSLPLNPSSVGESESCEGVAQAVAILSDRSAWPVYVHCTYGRDRTGLVVGAYRELVEGATWSSVDEELARYGHGASKRRSYPQISCELQNQLPQCSDEIVRALASRAQPAAAD